MSLPRKYHVEPVAALVRRVLRPAWAPTVDELLPLVETAARRIVHKRKLKACLEQMHFHGEIGSVGRGNHRRFVMITGRKRS